MSVNIRGEDTYESDFESGFRAGMDFARRKYGKVVERMILAGEDIVKITEYTRFTKEEIEEVRENLKQKLNGWKYCSRQEMDERIMYEEGVEEGRKRAREDKDIGILVSTLKEMSVPTETILEKIQKVYNLNLENAQNYVNS